MSVTRHLHSLQRPILATTMRCMAAFVHAFAMYCRHEGVWKMKLVSGTRSFTERRIPSLRLTDHISGNAKSDAIIGFFQGTSSSDCSQCNPSSAEWAVAWLSEGIRRVYIYIYTVFQWRYGLTQFLCCKQKRGKNGALTFLQRKTPAASLWPRSDALDKLQKAIDLRFVMRSFLGKRTRSCLCQKGGSRARH